MDSHSIKWIEQECLARVAVVRMTPNLADLTDSLQAPVQHLLVGNVP